MAFIGPRPLLIIDQPEDTDTRFTVRPGITGWAQVNGGRDILPADKAPLDHWYIQNASLRLDLYIIWRTFVMLTFGEAPNENAIRRAYENHDELLKGTWGSRIRRS